MPIARYLTWGARVPQALWAMALAVACAVVIVVAARSTPSGGQSQATGATPAMLRGIPQDGITLGRLSAPATLTAYVDPAFMSGELSDPATLRHLVDADVRPGRLKIQLRTVPSYDVPSLTDQGVPGARALQAAGLQNH